MCHPVGWVKGVDCVLWLMSLPPVFEADANSTKRSPVANLSQLHKTPLTSADPAPAQDPPLTEVLLTELKPDTHYNVTVYPQAADGTEGQPGKQEFETSRLDCVKWIQLSFIDLCGHSLSFVKLRKARSGGVDAGAASQPCWLSAD